MIDLVESQAGGREPRPIFGAVLAPNPQGRLRRDVYAACHARARWRLRQPYRSPWNQTTASQGRAPRPLIGLRVRGRLFGLWPCFPSAQTQPGGCGAGRWVGVEPGRRGPGSTDRLIRAHRAVPNRGPVQRTRAKPADGNRPTPSRPAVHGGAGMAQHPASRADAAMGSAPEIRQARSPRCEPIRRVAGWGATRGGCARPHRPGAST